MQVFADKFAQLDNKLTGLYESRNLNKLEQMKTLLCSVKEEDDEENREEENYSFNS